jgi:hypothetical protein
LKIQREVYRGARCAACTSMRPSLLERQCSLASADAGEANENACARYVRRAPQLKPGTVRESSFEGLFVLRFVFQVAWTA